MTTIPQKWMTAALAGAAALALCAPAIAQFAKPEDAIKYRRAAFTLMGTHFGRIGAMAQGKIPFDAQAAADNAAILLVVSKLPYAGFVDGTDKGDTKAKPEIWSDRAKFDAAAKKMQDAVVKLDAAAKAGGQDGIKAAAGDVGKACKACHDDYRKE